MPEESLVMLTADIVAAHVANNQVPVGDIATLIQTINATLVDLTMPAAIVVEQPKPAVSIKASVKPDHIVCLDCGKKFVALKRHVSAAHGMSTDDYKLRWGLPGSYSLVAPNYTEARRKLAFEIGLGTKRTGKKKPARKKLKIR